MTNETQAAGQGGNPSPKGTWRYRLGMVLFFGAIPIPFITPIAIGMLGLPAGESAALIGGVILTTEVLWFMSIPLLGKEGFKAVKQKAFGWLKLPTGLVSQARHRAGVWLLLGAVLLDVVLNLALVACSFAVEGAGPVLGLTFDQQTTVYIVVEVLTFLGVVVAMFVLGADFWERLKNAFTWQASGAAS